MGSAPYASCKISASLAWWFWRRRFLNGFYHIWAWWPSCISDQNHFSYFSFPQCLDAIYEIWLHLARWFQRRSHSKVWTDAGLTTETSHPISSPGAFGSGELKTVGGVDYTYSMPTNGWTDGQGQILMPPDYRHGGIKKMQSLGREPSSLGLIGHHGIH